MAKKKERGEKKGSRFSAGIIGAIITAVAIVGGQVIAVAFGGGDQAITIVNNVANGSPFTEDLDDSAEPPDEEDSPKPGPGAVDDFFIEHASSRPSDDIGKDLYQLGSGGVLGLEYSWTGLKNGTEVETEDCQIRTIVTGPDGPIPGAKSNECSERNGNAERITTTGTFEILVEDELTGTKTTTTFKVVP